jgi:hypothetical protein
MAANVVDLHEMAQSATGYELAYQGYIFICRKRFSSHIPRREWPWELSNTQLVPRFLALPAETLGSEADRSYVSLPKVTIHELYISFHTASRCRTVSKRVSSYHNYHNSGHYLSTSLLIKARCFWHRIRPPSSVGTYSDGPTWRRRQNPDHEA